MNTHVRIVHDSDRVSDDSHALMDLISGIRHYDLRRYCIDQIATARSAEDVRAAVSLAREVATRGT